MKSRFIRKPAGKVSKRLLIFIVTAVITILTIQKLDTERIKLYFTGTINGDDYNNYIYVSPPTKNNSNISSATEIVATANNEEEDVNATSTEGPLRLQVFIEDEQEGHHSSTTEEYSKVQKAPETTSSLLIDTLGCKLAKTDIFPAYYRENRDWFVQKMPNCDDKLHFIPFLDDTEEAVRLVHYPPENCTMWEIQRKPNGTDCDFEQISLGSFTSNTFNISSLELFMAECDGEYNTEARIPIHDDVRSKIEHWSKQRNGREENDDKRPINFLFLGIDAASRSHFYRSVPQTLKIMRSMGFRDFRGFHSFYPNTLNNLEPLLTGLKYAEVEGGCKPHWTDPYDGCPFIWQTLSMQNYVTLYLEDKFQSFNWMKCGGFEKQPTDYYPHPLFLAQYHYTRNQSKETQDCASSEPIPAFMARYTKRWLEQFKASAPFFALVFFDYPMHDFDTALPNMDLTLETLMLYLKSEPEILENTVIVLFGDHGIRFGDFPVYGGFEHAIERTLPALFIHFPQRLLRRDPNFAANVELNTGRLTTPLDVHHTLLHILSLTGLSLGPDVNETEASEADVAFEPSLPDRTSLLSEVPSNRTCESVGITAEYCVCNILPNEFAVENPEVMDRLLHFAVKELNEQVKTANLTGKCKKWYLPGDYTRLLAARVSGLTDQDDSSKQESNTTTVLFQFKAQPGDAQFELKIELEISDSDEVIGMKSLSPPRRINSYGDASHCISADSEQLKYMKELCYCKKRKREDRS